MIKRFFKHSVWLGLVGATLVLTLLIHSPAIAKDVAPTSPATPLHYTDLKFPPLPAIQIPKYVRYQLENGLVVYLMQDRQLP